MTVLQTLGARLRAARSAKRIDQQALADAVGKHVKTISRWENDRQVPEDDELTAAADALSVTVPWLRYGRDTADQLLRVSESSGSNYDPSIHAEERVPAIALSLPKEVRVWMHEFLLDLARADVSDREIEEARAVLTSPENATWWKDATPKEMLTAIESFADIIRDILRRRGYKLKASK